MKVRLPALLLVATALSCAQTVTPTSYSMENGELGPGDVLYRDDLYKGTGEASARPRTAHRRYRGNSATK